MATSSSPRQGPFRIGNNINALVIDSSNAGGGITVAISNDNGVAGGSLTSREYHQRHDHQCRRRQFDRQRQSAESRRPVSTPAGRLNIATSTNVNAGVNFFVSGQNATQTLNLVNNPQGSFSLSFPYYGNTIGTTLGNTGPATNLGAMRTVPISTTGITAAVIQAALEALPNIGPGNVTVDQQSSSSFLIRFIGQLGGGKVPALKVSNFLTSGNVLGLGLVARQITADLTVDANLSGASSGRKDRRGKLTLAGDNNGLLGQFTMLNGVVGLQNDQALGTFGSDKIVNAGSSLEIEDSHTIQASLVLNGSGFGNDNSGALRVYSTQVDSQTLTPLPAVVELDGKISLNTPAVLPILQRPSIYPAPPAPATVYFPQAAGQRD